MTLRLIYAAVGVVLTLVFQAPTGNARHLTSLQDTPIKLSPVVSQATYNRVLDILFTRNPSDSRKTIFAFVLRFTPSFKPESQIVIRKDLDTIKVIEYSSLDGNIYKKLNLALAQNGKENADEMAKLIKVKRREVAVPYSQVRQWHISLLDSIGDSLKTFRQKSDEYDKSGTESVFLDGTFYDLWYAQGLNEMSFRLYDEEVDDLHSTGDLKLVQWMNTVRREIARLK